MLSLLTTELLGLECGLKDILEGDAENDEDNADGDRLVLHEFYAAMGGPSWKRRDNWLSSLPLQRWYGVTTDENGRIKGIELVSNNMNGTNKIRRRLLLLCLRRRLFNVNSGAWDIHHATLF